MREREFEFGPLVKGSYGGLMAIFPVVLVGWPDFFWWYVFLMLFLGLGLRVLIEKTGIYRIWGVTKMSLDDKFHKRLIEKRQLDIDRKSRDDKYRKSRVKDPRLPKNW